jgi:hypothetical protein
MVKRISSEEMELLRECVSRHRPELLSLLGKLGRIGLTFDEREGLREAVSDEFAATGLEPDYEPNKRGLKLEDLIDILGHF